MAVDERDQNTTYWPIINAKGKRPGLFLPADKAKLDSLVPGNVGATGPTGPTGPPGATGATGPPGPASTVPGPPGADGHTTTLIGDSPPAGPVAGQLWWESDSGALFIWYDDGSSQQWVPANAGPQGEPGATGATGATGAAGTPGVVTAVASPLTLTGGTIDIQQASATLEGSLTAAGFQLLQQLAAPTAYAALAGYQSDWSAYGAPFTAQYQRDALGYVHFDGLVKKATNVPASSVICVLPTGFRPAQEKIFRVACLAGSTRSAEVRIVTTGEIAWSSGVDVAISWLALDGIAPYKATN